MGCYDDTEFVIVSRRFCLYSTAEPFTPETNSIEFVRKGRIRLESNGRLLDLVAPTLFWMKKGGKYRFLLNDTACEHVYFDFIGDRTDRILRDLENLCPEGCIVPEDPILTENLFSEMVDLYRRDPVLYHPELAVDSERLALQVIRSCRGGSRPQDDPYGILSIAGKIKSDPFRDYDFRRLSADAGISYEHFRRLFRQVHKLPPAAFVRDRQMFLAAEMLGKTNMRIKEVMATCRFDSMMNFSRSFKRYSGLSPEAYRKKIRG